MAVARRRKIENDGYDKDDDSGNNDSNDDIHDDGINGYACRACKNQTPLPAKSGKRGKNIMTDTKNPESTVPKQGGTDSRISQ